MKSEFATLMTFLERFQPEVVGHAEIAPADDVKAKLQRFASGACNEAERQELCDLLREKPDLIRWLAKEVKRQRGEAE